MTLQTAVALAGPELILVVSALAMLVWGAFQGGATRLFTLTAMVVLVAAAVAAVLGPQGRAFSGGLIVDSGTVFSKVIIYLTSAVAIPLGERWFARRNMARFEFPVLVLMAALGMGMMVSAGDLISLYISIELQSLALYILAAFHRGDEKSSEAALKYFVLGALSSGILLYGASLVYGFAGSTRFDVITTAMAHNLGLGALFGLVFVICGVGFKVSAGDLISLYISIELQSLALYILAAFHRGDEKSSEAALKYFVLGALSSGILLYGASLVYGFAGSTRFDVITTAMAHNLGLGALFGLVFVICGVGFKVSAAPFHMWTPDVYEGAPTPVVGFFAGAPKLAAMVLLARLLSQAFGESVDRWRQILVVMALLSVAVGAYAGLAQANLKRLWAYSSIATIGYALVGLAAGGAAGIQSMLVYMVLYVVDVTGFFACLAALSRQGRPLESMADFAGLVRERPGLGVSMTAFALSALGLPPMSGLWGKYYVFKAAVAAGLAPVAVIALLGSVVAAFYYLRLIKVMWFDPSPGATDTPPIEASLVTYGAALFSFPVVLLALIFIDPLAQTAAVALAAH
jgi:NADH-quinone oxidoreductase subunit N